MGLTFITAVSPDHLQYLPACTASVREQTTACDHLVMVDAMRQGPGRIRNLLLKKATTQYVSFLDADDWIEPGFAAQMLAVAERSTYVYSDWYQDSEVKRAPDRPWCNGTFHLVTAVVPRKLALEVGGFDETLPAMEDTDFFMKFVVREWCGTRVPAPLVHYRAHGGRSDAIHRTPEVLSSVRGEINRRYGGRPVGCCGDPSIIDTTPIGQQQPGDVLAMALWGGNRAEHGRATGRRYPRISYPKTTWVDPRDVRAAPNLWKEVNPEPVSVPLMPELSPLPAARGVAAIRQQMIGAGTLDPVAPTASKLEAPIPNFNKVKRLAGAVDLPVFVAPRTSWPSYTDFWRLVELAGFETTHADQIDLADDTKTFIFSGPEGIPDCTGARARTIFWQLEYAGDYANQGNIGTVKELWASDPENARQTGAKFVLLGSHKGLNPLRAQETLPGIKYDFSMLAYMTPRRQAIKDALDEFEWAPDYPGYANEHRHEVMSTTRLILNVNQFELATLAPLRLALAAAYARPVLAEKVPDGKPYKKGIIWSAYSRLAHRAIDLLDDKNDELRFATALALHELLCENHTFDKCVMEAVG